jgi:hypothetical protein
MADSAGKRLREAKKRQQREMKAERKRLRKEGLLGNDNSGLFAPGEMQRQVVDVNEPEQGPPAEPEVKADEEK